MKSNRKVRKVESVFDRLLEKQKITRDQLFAVNQYVRDYTIINQSNHARPSYCMPVSGGKGHNCEIKQGRLEASKRYNSFQKLFDQKFKKLKYRLLLQYAIERSTSQRDLKIITKTNNMLIDDMIVEIIEYIFTVY